MRIAIIGTGISGNVAARALNVGHEITVFEADDRPGGHTNTVDIESAGGRVLGIDTGFIVYNDRTYPRFINLLAELGQTGRPSTMSFSVRNEASGLEYCGSTLNGLFAQRSNLLRPRFLRMVRDILHFNRSAVAGIQSTPADATIGEFMAARDYGDGISRDYLLPMIAAIWSAEPARVADMPLHFLVRFFHNHGLLQVRDRPQWYTIAGGSRQYLEKLIAGHRHRIRFSTPVESVRRLADCVLVTPRKGRPERFDHVFIACHADQALRLLADPTPTEREVLGAIRYQDNEAVLHTDTTLLPMRRRAWAAWNYRVPAIARKRATVTYNMNILQGLAGDTVYCVTLNDDGRIHPSKILYRTSYAHPVFSTDAVAAQSRHAELNSGKRTSYCGAYWRNGFHEDGVWSAEQALEHFRQERQHEELHLRRTG